MNKADLTKAILKKVKVDGQYVQTGGHYATMDEAYVRRFIDATTEAITNAFITDDRVTIVGFGTFSSRMRNAREGRNPKTGEIIHITESRVVSFKPGLEFKKVVANVDTDINIDKNHLISIQAFTGTFESSEVLPKIKTKVLTLDENIDLIHALRKKTNVSLLNYKIETDDEIVTLSILKDNFVEFMNNNLDVKESVKSSFFKFRKSYDFVQITLKIK
tara:strand:- start:108 stop:761 length:654 start_codon:yes stop_codon:yes gene_type:complete